jgi:hypothetical protein
MNSICARADDDNKIGEIPRSEVTVRIIGQAWEKGALGNRIFQLDSHST